MHTFISRTAAGTAPLPGFAEALDGELATIPLGRCADAGCPCQQAFVGLASNGYTRQVEVVDRPELTPERFALLIGDHLSSYHDVDPDDPDEQRWIRVTADQLAGLADRLGTGTVIERCGDALGVVAFPPGIEVFGAPGSDPRSDG